MLDINHVLFPTDFSEGAEPAFPQAVHFAEWHDATLHILNVRTSAQPDDLDTTREFPVPFSTMQGWLDRAGHDDANGPSLKNVEIEQTQVDSAAPPEAIVDFVEGQGIDLIVMGTHGRRGLDRVRFGSVTEEVVRTAPAPVLTVQADAPSSVRTVRRVLTPIDFSDASETALRHAKEIALTQGAEIDLLHVVDKPMFPSAYGVDSAEVSTEELLDKAEQGLGDLARDIVGHEHAMVKAVAGHPVEEILNYVEKNDVDLLVIATHGRTGLNRLLIGSVAERVIRQSPIPVFLVKPERASLLSGATEQEATAEVE
jgi:nucleotide-binding universal stress UspA family protein